MKTLIISDQYGIFCGMNGKFACFSKDAILSGSSAYAFDTKEKAQAFVDKFPENYQKIMWYKDIDHNSNYVPLHVLLKEGLEKHTGHMLDILVPENSTLH